jgi:uncharacterized protein (DUF427 family)
MRAVWNGTVIAESSDTVVVEGNHYFPADSINWQLLEPTDTATVCPWKGTASYYSTRVGDSVGRDVAWTYVTPKPAAAEITGRLAFWRGVRIEQS